MKRLEKKERRGLVREEFRHHPSFTDEELAVKLAVSVATIRLDRQQLGIPQLRDRMEQAVQKVAEFPSDLRSDVKILDITPGEKGIAMVTTTDEMLNFSGFVPAERLYGMAAGLAEAVLEQPAGAAQVGNIKYKEPIGAGVQLIAKAKVVRMRGQRKYVWVFVMRNETEVFRAKFIMDMPYGREIDKK